MNMGAQSLATSIISMEWVTFFLVYCSSFRLTPGLNASMTTCVLESSMSDNKEKDVSLWNFRRGLFHNISHISHLVPDNISNSIGFPKLMFSAQCNFSSFKAFYYHCYFHSIVGVAVIIRLSALIDRPIILFFNFFLRFSILFRLLPLWMCSLLTILS